MAPPVLIVVDVQNGFVRTESAHVVPVIANLVPKWLDLGGDLVFTRYFNYPGSAFERLVHWSKMQGGPETDIVPELLSFTDQAVVLDKTGYTFFSEEGDKLVRDRRWTEIYVCGIATESCVLKTAVDAFERDLTPWLIEDASASHAGLAAHDAGILVTRRFIGDGQIVRTAEALSSLTKSD